jgi:hypothetical protein
MAKPWAKCHMSDQFRGLKSRHGYCVRILPYYRKENPRTFAEAFSSFRDMQNDKRENLQDIDAGQIQRLEPLHSGKT